MGAAYASSVALRTDDVTGARSYVGEALGLFSNAGDVTGISLLLDDAGEVAMAEGDRSRCAPARLRGDRPPGNQRNGLGNLLNLEERRSRREDVAGELTSAPGHRGKR